MTSLGISLVSAGTAFAQPPGPTQSELDAAGTTPANWLMTNKSYDGQRFVALDQINTGNVKQLKTLCSIDTGVDAPAQSSPVLYDGRIYLSVGQTTLAIDATTCKEIWRYEWKLRGKALSKPNRGVAIKDGRVVRGTSDGYLIALSMENGKLLWKRQITSADKSHYLSMPAMIVEDRVIYGTAGADWGSRGWIGAFRLKDGKPLWRFEALPKPGEKGAETWGSAKALRHGGGSFWTPVAVDRKAGIVYTPIGNPAPDFYGDVRKGDNLYTNALVALDLKKGRPVWRRQFVPHDIRDWDLTQTSPLLDISKDGKERPVVVVSGKDGRLRLVDRSSHDVLFDVALVKQQNTDVPLTTDGVHICPGLLGGQEWSSTAFDRVNSLLISPMVNWCGTAHRDEKAPVHKVGERYYGGKIVQDPVDQGRGMLSAVDPATGAVRWQMEAPTPMLGNVTVTSGGARVRGRSRRHPLCGQFADRRAPALATAGRLRGGRPDHLRHQRQAVSGRRLRYGVGVLRRQGRGQTHHPRASLRGSGADGGRSGRLARSPRPCRLAILSLCRPVAATGRATSSIAGIIAGMTNRSAPSLSCAVAVKCSPLAVREPLAVAARSA